MSKFLDTARSLDQLAEDYKITAQGIKATNGELVEIMVSVSTRLQQEQRRNEELSKELQATINNTTGRTEIVRKMAEMQLKHLETQTPQITLEERQMFQEKAAEAGAAIGDMRRIEQNLKTARAELKQELDENFKLSKLYPLDAELLSSHIESTEGEFKRRFGSGMEG